jgi:peptidoglycan-associated lipoprotein
VKKKVVLLSVSVLILVLGFALMTGCSKKIVKDVTEEQKTSVQKEEAATVSSGETEAQRLAREKAVKETALREQQEKERLLAAQREKEAAASRFGDILFDYDSADLKPESRETLKKLADYLTAKKQASVLIEGNCDERGTVEYNLALGEKRALSAMKYLNSLGIDKGRTKIISYGKERPLDPGHNEAAWTKNRRDHFVVTAK